MSFQSLKPHIAHTILARAHSPETAESLFTERVKQKPLFLSPATATAADSRERRRLQRLRKKEYFLRKQKPQPLSAREKRATGVHRLDAREMKYDVFAALHWMWIEYMQDLLELKRPCAVNQATHGSKLTSADYHGAKMEVVRSRCVGRVGTKGIVVRDSKFAFVLINEKDQLKTIPKEHTIFKFEIPRPKAEDQEGQPGAMVEKEEKPLVLELHGSQFVNRPMDRANRKFKWRNLDYL